MSKYGKGSFGASAIGNGLSSGISGYGQPSPHHEKKDQGIEEALKKRS
jgi:hypothetical protein